MEALLRVAFGELGVEELPDEQHNPVILRYASDTGIGGMTTDEVPWCSAFVNWVAWKCGLQHSRKSNARSWLNVGQRVNSPEPGDVVVFWRDNPQSWKGHVGFFLGLSPDGTRVYCLGGNQGNRVSVSAYRVETVISYQRLAPSAKILIPSPTLQKGSRGKQVGALQDALKLLHIDVGTSDGAFGPRTEAGVMELQTRQPDLQINGIYNDLTRNLLESLFQE